MISPPEDIVPPLLAWYARVARPLPWRANPTGYHVLLSELLCQQTRVDTAIPYFHRFVNRWPTIDDLAAASEEDVVAAWAGLGYYRRARALHGIARAAVARGGLPDDVDGLLALPGVGPYTAGAIASIAFGRSAAAVDGNVERVLSRLDRGPEAPWSTAGKRSLHARASSLYAALPDGAHAGALTQALMELGATVCAPRPSCGACPIAGGCAARAAGDTDAWPRRRDKAAPKEIFATFVLIDGPDGRLLARREPAGLLGGLWEPPRVDHAERELAPDVVANQIAALIGLKLAVGPLLGTLKHVFSHRVLVASVRRGRVIGGSLAPRAPYDDAAWEHTPADRGLSALAVKALTIGGQPALPLETPLLAAEALVTRGTDSR